MSWQQASQPVSLTIYIEEDVFCYGDLLFDGDMDTSVKPIEADFSYMLDDEPTAGAPIEWKSNRILKIQFGEEVGGAYMARLTLAASIARLRNLAGVQVQPFVINWTE